MISIKVENAEEDTELIKPSKMYGAAHGTIFRMYTDNKPSDTYFIGTGGSDRPICIWFDDESGNYRLSSDSAKDLKRLLPHIRVKECPYAKIEIKLDIE